MKQLPGCHYQRNLESKLTRIEPSILLRLEKYSRSITDTFQKQDVAEFKEMLQMTVYIV